jgi:Fe-S cluster assembly protein SufD
MSGAAPASPWLELTARARARAEALGLPTTALEAWRYVDVRPCARVPTAPAIPVTAAEVAPHRLGLDTVVLVDGALRDDLGHGEPAMAVEDVFALPAVEAAALAAGWGASLDASDDVSECWTLAELAGALRIRARGVAARPLHLLAIATGGASAARLVIELAPGAALDLVVTHVGLAACRTSVGIEVEVGPGAALRVDEVQYGAADAQLHRLARVSIARDANARWTTAARGADLVRFRTHATLAAVGAEATLDGLSVLAGARQAHQYVRVRHEAGPTTSAQLFKAVADERGIASFDGLVAIAKGADGSNAGQGNHNLLLARTARIDSRPQLDILADDVKASHGATVGQPSADEVFYLRSRGLPQATAIAMLTRGFADEVVTAMRNPAARALAQREIVGNLGR